MGESEESKVSWITCPECEAKIGIILSVGRAITVNDRDHTRDATQSLSYIWDRLESTGIDLSLLDVEEVEEVIRVRPKRFLDDLWGPINEAVRSLGGSWIREGRDSRWEIRRSV